MAAFLAGVLGHLPALGAWWNQDDWGLLARAAGLLHDGTAARWLGQTAYWSLLYPLAGLAPEPYAATRLLLHGGCAALVARLAGRGGLGPAGQLVAGLLFAVAAPAFTPLYWASGVQELLGAALALLALDRWLAGGRRALLLAIAAGLLSFTAKENGLALPLLLAVLLVAAPRAGDRPRLRWLAVGLLAAAAAGEALLVWRHFDHGPGRPYALGDLSTSLHHLAGYGWCLVRRPSFFAPPPDAGRVLTGSAVWLGALLLAVLAWRRGRRLPAAALLGALLSLAPVLPLAAHLHPYYLYLPSAGLALLVAGLLPRRAGLRPGVAVALAAAAVLVAFTACELRLKARDLLGHPADPLVLRTAISHRACVQLRDLAAGTRRPRAIVLLQNPPPGPLARMAERLGERYVMGSLLHTALGRDAGPRLLLPDGPPVRWASGLQEADPAAVVLAEDGPLLHPWGPVPQALLYLVLTDVGRGRFARAERALIRAARLGGDRIPLLYDPDRLPVTAAQVAARADAFRTRLLYPDPDRGPALGGADLATLWDRLLRICLEDAPENTGD